MIDACAETIDDVSDVSVAPVSAMIDACAETIDDVSDVSVAPVSAIIEVLAFVIASVIVCRFMAARAGVVVREGTPSETSLKASATINA